MVTELPMPSFGLTQPLPFYSGSGQPQPSFVWPEFQSFNPGPPPSVVTPLPDPPVIMYVPSTSPYMVPIILDLNGDGISIDQLGSSNRYFDTVGDGYQRATAWAGAGDGVLAIDLDGTGVIDQPNEINFTLWDPTAQSDMQALLDVFDTNHNAQLDAGDTNWSKFGVVVTNADGTTQFKTLAQLAITSINLIGNEQKIVLPDGSSIRGEATYTKADGTTGIVADATLAYDPNGYVIATTTTHNADGSTTIDNKALNGDGSLANETIGTTSADGKSVTISTDTDGDGVVDGVQSKLTVLNPDGSSTRTITNFDGTGTHVVNRTATTTSADLKTVTVNRDSTGGGVFDQIEVDAKDASGNLTVTISDLNPNGSLKARSIATTSASGLSKTTGLDVNGDGVIDLTQSGLTVINGDGSKVETVSDSNTDTSLRSRVVTLTSADHLTKTIQDDKNGDGTVDLTRISSIVVAVDGSSVTTQQDRNGDNSLRSKIVTTLSADGLSRTTQRDEDGNGTFDLITTDATVHNADGSITQTVTDLNADGSLRDRTTTTRSADGRARTIQADVGNQTVFLETIAVAADGSSVDTAYDVRHQRKMITSTSADGLSKVIQTQEEIGNPNSYRTENATTIVNADGSSVLTQVDLNANGSLRGKTVVATSANGLSTTVQQDTTGDGNFDLTVTDVIVRNADGSSIDTLTGVNPDGSLKSKTVTAVSSDRNTATTQIDSFGDGHFDQVQSRVVNVDGSVTATVADYNANGSLKGRTISTASASGLSVTTQIDANGDGVVDLTQTDVTALNADGSRTETISNLNTDNALRDRTIVTTSATGLSRTTQSDLNGDGVVDATRTDVTVLNVDGSRTETVSDRNQDNSLKGRAVTTTSATGLSRTTQVDADGNGTFEQTRTEVTVLNADGSRTETVSDLNGNQTLRNRVTATLSADGNTVSIARDITGDGIVDQTTTDVLNVDGSRVQTASNFNADGTLRDRSVVTTSTSGLSVTVQSDIDGNGSIDQTRTDVTVLNADGSRTETITDRNANNSLRDKTVITTSANGLSTTTQQDMTGDGNFDLTVTDVTVLGANGSSTETVTGTNPDGSLKAKTVTTVSSDRNTATTQVDSFGDGQFDQVRTRVVSADGSVTATVADYNANGSLNDRTVTTTSASGLSTTTQQDKYGSGTFCETQTDVTVLNADGSRTETISNLNSDNALRDRTIVTISATGLSRTTQWDRNGDGVVDMTRTDVTVLNVDGSRTETVTDRNHDTSLKGRTVTTTSANGLSVTMQVDADGNGSFEQTRTGVTVLNADGSRTETVSGRDGNQTLRNRVTTITSADGNTVSSERDINGDGAVDQTATDVLSANGSRVRTVSDFNADATLRDRGVVTTSASGLSVTTQIDANGDSVVDLTQTDVTILNADGSRTETITDFNANGSLRDKTVVTTSANGLSTTTQQDKTGDGNFDLTITDVTVLGANGSSTETLTGTNADGSLKSKTVTTVSSDRNTATTQIDSHGVGHFDQVQSRAVNVDGSVTATVADYNTNGSLKDRTVTTTSASGLSVTTQIDANGDGLVDVTANRRHGSECGRQPDRDDQQPEYEQLAA